MQTPLGWIAPLDLGGVLVIALLLLLGLARGLWWQVIRLLGVTAAVLTARWLGPPVAARLLATWTDLESRTAHGIAWGGLFLLALLLASFLGILGQRTLEAMKLDLANRIAGGCAGAATGLGVHVAVVLILCQIAPAPALHRYVAGTYSERLYGTLGLRWPVALASDPAQEVDQVLEQSPRHVHPPGVVR